MKAYLRGSNDFQKVYRQGKRYEGALMTAFVLPNNLSHNRLVLLLPASTGKRSQSKSSQATA